MIYKKWGPTKKKNSDMNDNCPNLVYLSNLNLRIVQLGDLNNSRVQFYYLKCVITIQAPNEQ